MVINYSDKKNEWKKNIAPFQTADLRKSIWQLTNTVGPFLALWCLAYLSLSVSIWLGILLACVNSGFFVRIFIIFHDCGHHSFFKSRRANEIVGVITGIMTFFPYHQWKYEHAVHHATSGDLNRRGTGDMWTLTVDEYLELPTLHRVAYRLYRNPIVMLGLGPLLLFFYQYRLNRKGAGRKERLNTHITNISLVLLYALLSWILGWKDVLLVEGPTLYISGVIGIWLFYVQHQFEDTYLERSDKWDYVSAALHGSSFYKLPAVLQWVTGNIGFHHVHHLGPRIPNYHLERAHNSHVLFQNAPSISLRASLRSLKYRLWDEDNQKFVTFKEIKIEQESRKHKVFVLLNLPVAILRIVFRKSSF